MRLLSQIFQPVITIPKDAIIKNTDITCKSQKLLLECGLVRPTGSGLFTILPLARRAITKLENIIHRCLEEAGAQRLALPSLTPARLWRRSGRLARAGTELLQLDDRHGKRYVLAPTHEEAITDLIADVGPLSYKQLPLLLYQIGNKYRDEQRPKHGLLRAREFSMMDAYSVHATSDCAANTYNVMTDAYNKIFRTLDLPVRRVEAPAGEMGGSLSHEWQLPAPAGEDALAVCPSCSHAALAARGNECEQCGRQTDALSSIEVGHTFALGARYSEPLQALGTRADASVAPLHMGCYGVGLTRLLSAAVEALSTDTALRWPRAMAPYSTVVIGPKEGSKEWLGLGVDRVEGVARRLERHLRDDVLLDDRHHLTIGKRLMLADRMGYPNIVVCGRSALEHPPRYELYRSSEGAAPQLLDISQLLDALADQRVADAEYSEECAVK